MKQGIRTKKFKKPITTAVQKTDVGFVVALVRMFSEVELHLTPRQIRALAKQMLVLWLGVKRPARFVRLMNGFFERAEDLGLPAEKVALLMARELGDESVARADG